MSKVRAPTKTKQRAEKSIERDAKQVKTGEGRGKPSDESDWPTGRRRVNLKSPLGRRTLATKGTQEISNLKSKKTYGKKRNHFSGEPPQERSHRLEVPLDYFFISSIP
jgi:ribosomal protein S19E (S16A)